ncbi:N-acetylmuramoyl-L-alanine amidase [Putridiphycobacter roseus]|uniref:Peptidoglycan hydrolase n=1 Tax=Putridiphycobacter roseus TaxID=2219161 RepID=A0A2W1NHB5_9FLAO|nr:glucosaminidase domain-containing protein [Putridiphycobacter roseus]PZE17386.1 N-acetylmuramoyl-L-alanine amidase [Putridiphycobacter roseus]
MKILLLTGFLLTTSIIFGETKYSSEQYIDMWKNTAIAQMLSHKIPASITLAQGILESANGNSKLAKEANNHFGIKCHKAWSGATFIQDDDTKNECFRSYVSAADSYTDHSLFLSGRGRYAGLFELKLTDYKGWARGLKSAGYATNPKYAHLLIEIIERFHLNQYDKYTSVDEKDHHLRKKHPSKIAVMEDADKKHNNTHENANVVKGDEQQATANNNTIVIRQNSHRINTNKNKVKFIVVKEGDTYLRIANEFEMTINQLYKYNEFIKKDVLEVGEIVYIAPKKGRALRMNEMYTCQRDLSLREIAHEEGIRLNNLMKINLISNPEEIINKGTKVTLR